MLFSIELDRRLAYTMGSMNIKQKAPLVAVACALVLAAGKFSAGLASGSMALASSGLDSLLDVFMSAMNFFAIQRAAKPADDDHRYGHGKVEDLAALLQSSVIVFSGGIIIYTSVQGFIHNKPISYSALDISVMIASLCFSFFISRYLKAAGDKTDSNALRADALHYRSDLYSNSGAIVAIILTVYTGRTFYDLLFAVITGCIIIYSALQIAKKGLQGLTDSSIPHPLEKQIEDILGQMAYPYVGYHKLRTRYSGSKKYVDFHLLTCRKLHVDEAHELADRVEKKIVQELVTVDIVVHLEPCVYTCELTEATCAVLKTGARAQRNNPAFRA
jgi:cation diffusion facilitator family transporter